LKIRTASSQVILLMISGLKTGIVQKHERPGMWIKVATGLATLNFKT
jgi:hypothetical protein